MNSRSVAVAVGFVGVGVFQFGTGVLSDGGDDGLTVPNHHLEKVVVIGRHGDRSPLTRSLGSKVPASLQQDRFWADKLPDASVLDGWNRVLPRDCSEPYFDVIRGFGVHGQLTRKGALETRMVGHGFRERYVEQLGFLPATCPSTPGSISFRSTNFARTHQSVQNIALGLYPDLGSRDSPFPVEVRARSSETLVPSSKCTTLTAIVQSRILPQRTPGPQVPGSDLPDLAAYVRDCFGTKRVSFTHVNEVATCSRAHGWPLPPKFTPEVASLVEAHACDQWTLQHRDSDVTALTSGPLLREVSAVFGMPGTPETVYKHLPTEYHPKFAVWIGHDSTLIPLLVLFNGSADKPLASWPPYSSMLSLELWTSDDNPAAKTVQILFNGQLVRRMSLAEFTSTVNDLITRNFLTECVMHAPEGRVQFYP